MPGTAETIWKQLGFKGPEIHELPLDEALKPPKVGTKIINPQPVISKIDDDLLESLKTIIDNRIKAAEKVQSGEQPVEEKEMITFEHFKKLDLRAGKILKCEKVPKKDKLLLLEVDIGTEKRTIVTGLADQYKPEQLLGMTALFLTNLEPKKIGGIESHGMIIAVEKGDQPGRWLPVRLDDVPPGSKAA